MDDWVGEWDCGDMPKIKYVNMSFTDRIKFFNNQGEACALCRIKFDKGLDPVVDHCHDTGNVRGLLCSHCNKSLGYTEKRGRKFLERVRDYVFDYGDIVHTNEDYY